MSYYRDTYLKSEHWQNLRLEKLAGTNTMCSICGHRSISNDVHHITYGRSIWEIKTKGLRVLCRPCHENIHHTVDTYFKDSAKSPEEKWSAAFLMIEDERVYQRDDRLTARQQLYDREEQRQWEPLFSWCFSANAIWALKAMVYFLTWTNTIQVEGNKKHVIHLRAQRDAKIARILSGKSQKGDSKWLVGALKSKAWDDAQDARLRVNQRESRQAHVYFQT